jgi:hypothetical protein
MLFATLVVLVPMFVRLSTWGDTTLFDLAARSLLKRGSCYRDIFMHGPPGMVWFQLGVRSLVGWSSEALRCADLVILSAAVWLMLRASEPGRYSRAASVWLAAILYLCYFTSTEWAHCQPDGWMLLPALGALVLQQRQVATLAGGGGSDRMQALGGVAEGALWAFAFLMKPFVVVPAALCVLLSLVLMIRTVQAQRPLQHALRYLASLFCGAGLIIGGAILLLFITGDWGAFVTATFGGWNSDYIRFSANWGHRTVEAVTQWPWPWNAIHALAVPVAVFAIGRAIFSRATPTSQLRARRGLFAAFYLGWFFQANYLQLQFEYQIVPALLLAWCVVFGEFWYYAPRLTLIAALPAAAVGLAICQPLLTTGRMAVWTACFRSGNSDYLKDTLMLNWGEGHTSWQDLRGVINFLKSRGAGDREVTCWHWSAIPLYTEMKIEPSTRFVFPGSRLGYFPSFKKLILDETMGSPQRFLVADLFVTMGPNFNYHQPMEFPLDSFGQFKAVHVEHCGRYIVLELIPTAQAEKAPE